MSGRRLQPALNTLTESCFELVNPEAHSPPSQPLPQSVAEQPSAESCAAAAAATTTETGTCQPAQPAFKAGDIVWYVKHSEYGHGILVDLVSTQGPPRWFVDWTNRQQYQRTSHLARDLRLVEVANPVHPTKLGQHVKCISGVNCGKVGVVVPGNSSQEPRAKLCTGL